MRILLVEAAVPRDGLAWSAYTDDSGRFAMPSAGLVSIASMVSPDDDVRIIDEKVSEPVRAADVTEDLIGISAKTMDASRAYHLADALRKLGKTVVIGGVHATLQPEEAAEHADAVSAGEGEDTWPRILEDFQNGTLQPMYKADPGKAQLSLMPPQRHELMAHDRYLMHAVQSARGCSFDCEFCPTRILTGSGYRQRTVDHVAAEVEQLMQLQEKPLFFTENIFGAGDVQFIRELTGRLKGMCKNYVVICDYQALVPEIAAELANNGCSMVMVNVTGKHVAEEIAALDNARAAGLKIWGYYMFGFEDDTPDVFQRAIDRTLEYDMVCASLSVLTPFPGTPMGERLVREDRVFCRDATLMDHNHVLFQPNQMTISDLQQGFAHVRRELKDRLNIQRAVDCLQ